MAEKNSLTTPPPNSDVKTAGPNTAAHTEHPAGGHSAAFPPFETHTFLAQLIWLALAFGLLYYLMSKIALPRIESILHDRSQRLSADLDEAQRMKAEADAAGEATRSPCATRRPRPRALPRRPATPSRRKPTPSARRWKPS